MKQASASIRLDACSAPISHYHSTHRPARVPRFPDAEQFPKISKLQLEPVTSFIGDPNLPASLTTAHQNLATTSTTGRRLDGGYRQAQARNCAPATADESAPHSQHFRSTSAILDGPLQKAQVAELTWRQPSSPRCESTRRKGLIHAAILLRSTWRGGPPIGQVCQSLARSGMVVGEIHVSRSGERGLRLRQRWCIAALLRATWRGSGRRNCGSPERKLPCTTSLSDAAGRC